MGEWVLRFGLDGVYHSSLKTPILIKGQFGPILRDFKGSVFHSMRVFTKTDLC